MPDNGYRGRAITSATVAALFSTHDRDLVKVRGYADSVYRLINRLDTRIEGYTSVVCPSCSQVCCIDRHAVYAYDDLIYLHALGLPLPQCTPGIADTASCQFLGPSGCIMNRTHRPYRCTWYFCTPLLDHMHALPARAFRTFSSMFEELSRTRSAMINAFAAVTGISQHQSF